MAIRVIKAKPIQILTNVLRQNGHKGGSLGIIGRAYTTLKNNFNLSEEELLSSLNFKAAHNLAQTGMLPHVIASLLNYNLPYSEIEKTKDSELILPTIKAFRQLIKIEKDIIKPDIPTELISSNYQNMLLNIPFNKTKDEDIFHAHMLRAAIQYSVLQAMTANTYSDANDILSTLKLSSFELPVILSQITPSLVRTLKQIRGSNFSNDFGLINMQNPAIFSLITTSTAVYLRQMGFEWLSNHMLDLSQRILKPDEYNYIYQQHFKVPARVMNDFLEKSQTLISQELFKNITILLKKETQRSDKHVRPQIMGRIKTVWSTRKKLGRRPKIVDIAAMRIVISSKHLPDNIVNVEDARKNGILLGSSQEAYKSACDLAYLYSRELSKLAANNGWMELEDESDDYIKEPKLNGYQAIQQSFFTNIKWGTVLTDNIPKEIGKTKMAQFFRSPEKESYKYCEVQPDIEYKVRNDTELSPETKERLLKMINDLNSEKVYFEIQIQTQGMYEQSITGKASHRLYKGLESPAATSPLDYFFALKSSLKRSTYAFTYEGILNGAPHTIIGPYELTAKENRKVVTSIDLAYAADPILAERTSQIFKITPPSKKERPIGFYDPLSGRELIRQELRNKQSVPNKDPNRVGTNIAHNKIYFENITKGLSEKQKEELKEKGKAVFDRAVEELGILYSENWKEKINNHTTSILLRDLLISKLGIASLDDLFTLMGRSQIDLLRVNFFISQLFFTTSHDQKQKKAFFVFQKNSNLGAYILNQIAYGKNLNISSVKISTKDNLSLLILEPLESNEYKGLIELLQKSMSSFIKEISPLGAKESMKLTIDINKDRIGLIADIISELNSSEGIIDNAAIEKISKGKISSRFNVLVPKHFPIEKLNKCLNKLGAIKGVKRVSISK